MCVLSVSNLHAGGHSILEKVQENSRATPLEGRWMRRAEQLLPFRRNLSNQEAPSSCGGDVRQERPGM